MADMLESMGFVVKMYKDREPTDPANVVYAQATVDRYRPDFILPWAQIAIEVDGKHWHTKARDKLDDMSKWTWFNQNGWSTIHISDWDVGKAIKGYVLGQILLSMRI